MTLLTSSLYLLKITQDIFDSADKILIERQPPGGFTNIEILLNYMFKDKVTLISPVSMHMSFLV